MPLSTLTGTEGTHLDVLNKINSNLTYLDGKSSGGGGGTYNLTGNANYIPTFDEIGGATISEAIEIITVGGRIAEGDCRPFRMKRVTRPSGAKAWDFCLCATDDGGQIWEYLLEANRIDFKQTGAPTDHYDSGFTSDPIYSIHTHWDALMAFLYDNSGDKNNAAPPIAEIDMTGAWFVSRTLYSKNEEWGGRLMLTATIAAQKPTTYIRGLQNIDILVLDHVDTLRGAGLGSGDSRKSAEGFAIENILFWFVDDTCNTNTDCVRFYTRGRFSGCVFSQAGRYGAHGYANVGYGNNDNTIFRDCVFQYNHWAGLRAYHGNANAWTVEGCSWMFNGGCGYDAFDFLGNHCTSMHFEGNSVRYVNTPKFQVFFEGSVYLAVVAPEMIAHETTVPGTNNQIWEWYYDDPSAGSYMPTWFSGITPVEPSGSIVQRDTNSRGVYDKVYREAGEMPFQIRGRGIIPDGGLKSEGGHTRNSTGIIEWDNIRWVGAYSTASYDPHTDDIKGTERTIVDIGGGRPAGLGGNVLSITHGNVGAAPIDRVWRFARLLGTNDYRFFTGKLLGGNTPHGVHPDYAGAITALADGQIYFPEIRLGADPYSRKITFINASDLFIVRAGIGDVFFIEAAAPGDPKIVECITAGTYESGTLAFRVIARQEWVVKGNGYAPGSIAVGSMSAEYEIPGAPGAGNAFVERATHGGNTHGLKVNAWTYSNSVYFRFENPAGNPYGPIDPGTVSVWAWITKVSSGFGV